MAKHSLAGFPHPNEAGRESPRPDRVGGGFYMFLARDGQARWTEVQIGHQAEASRADRSFYVAGWGSFSWRGVLSLVPRIWEAPFIRDFPRRQEGEEGQAIMALGSGLTNTIPL